MELVFGVFVLGIVDLVICDVDKIIYIGIGLYCCYFVCFELVYF